MSLKANIVASYVGQVYVTGASILALPLCVKNMGMEAYGLVGFFTMLQAWFVLLDLGLTATVGRETARFRGGVLGSLEYRQIVRALGGVFLFVALLGGGLLWLGAERISREWLKFSSLTQQEVVLAIEIMALIVAMRWVGGGYRGVINSFERIVWLSGFNVVIATLRFFGVLGWMWLFGFTPFVFFSYQLVVAVLELLGLFVMVQRLLPGVIPAGAIGWSLRPVRPLLSFTLAAAFASSISVLITQADKLVLSGILPLAEYGHFSLAVLVAGGIFTIITPVSNTVVPRMTRLYAEGDKDGVVRIYRAATRLVSAIGGAAVIVLCVCAEPLLWIWTGDLRLVEEIAPIMRLYAIGNGLLIVSVCPNYLQYASGQLRYHLWGNVIMVLVLVPMMVLFSMRFGMKGAAYVWMLVNLVYLVTWIAYVHWRLVPGLFSKWLLGDVMLTCLPSVVFSVAVLFFGAVFESVVANIIYIAGITAVVLFLSLWAVPEVRQWSFRMFALLMMKMRDAG
ncbi:MAG: lipopolysaccharide biosynthesis protein [Pseudomonas sp.]